MPVTKPSCESESFQIVLIGSFNPAIFHPQWFYRYKLIGADEAPSEQVRVVSAEFADISLGSIHIQCLSNRLTLEVPSIAFVEKLQDLIAAILALLPHTPVKGCGLNATAHYRLKGEQGEEYWHKIGHTLAPKETVWNKLFPDPKSPPGLATLVILGQRTGEWPGPTNITVQPSALIKPGIFVASNYHYDVSDDIESSESANHIRLFIEQVAVLAFENARVAANVIFDSIPS
jgi:hypothetical protein